jgi:hypothetical protein
MASGISPSNAIDGDIVWTDDGSNHVLSDGSVSSVITLDQDTYDGLTPDAETLYFITDA